MATGGITDRNMNVFHQWSPVGCGGFPVRVFFLMQKEIMQKELFLTTVLRVEKMRLVEGQ